MDSFVIHYVILPNITKSGKRIKIRDIALIGVIHTQTKDLGQRLRTRVY
jgi:hypothetical protein